MFVCTKGRPSTARALTGGTPEDPFGSADTFGTTAPTAGGAKRSGVPPVYTAECHPDEVEVTLLLYGSYVVVVCTLTPVDAPRPSCSLPVSVPSTPVCCLYHSSQPVSRRMFSDEHGKLEVVERTHEV